MEGARVIDEVVGPFGERRIEDGAALGIHRGAGLFRPLLGPFDRLGREVNGIDAASEAGQVGSVPPVSASQLEHTCRSEHAFAEPRNEVLVGPFGEERARLGAVKAATMKVLACKTVTASSGIPTTAMALPTSLIVSPNHSNRKFRCHNSPPTR